MQVCTGNTGIPVRKRTMSAIRYIFGPFSKGGLKLANDRFQESGFLKTFPDNAHDQLKRQAKHEK